jgi:signal transduction histidine kinase
MQVKTENEKTQVLERLLSDARTEADELRAKLARYEQILVSTRLIMGHELKKPATAITGYLELVAEDLENRQQHDALAFVHKAVDECALLNDLNDYFIELLRVGKASDAVGRPSVDIDQLFAETAAHVREQFHTDRAIDVTVDLADARVNVDANALKLVVINLLENAIRYSQVDSPVRLEAERGYDRRGRTERPLLKIRVIDDGVGIPPRYVNRVFEPFVRLRSDIAGGSGLGLTLVRSLVELNGGEVSIDSTTGQGTTVFVTLPIDPARNSEPIIHL